MTIVEHSAGERPPASAEAMYWLNVLALYLIAEVLIAAYYMEFADKELPCPLCLLQRIALCGMGAGVILNLRTGISPRNYGLILLAAASGGVFAVRQILLHIAPGDPGYGSPFFGLHYYTWSAIVFGIAILATGLALLFDTQFARARPRRLEGLAVIGIVLVLGATIANAVTTFLECGLHECPDNPVTFELLGWPN